MTLLDMVVPTPSASSTPSVGSSVGWSLPTYIIIAVILIVVVCVLVLLLRHAGRH